MNKFCYRIYHRSRWDASVLVSHVRVFKTRQAAQEFVNSLWEGDFPRLVESIRREPI
jgi:hypothetical protein